MLKLTRFSLLHSLVLPLPLILLSSAALAATAIPPRAGVVSISPQNRANGAAETSNQVRVKFSEPMVRLDVDPDASAVSVECTPSMTGRAQWEDDKTWTYDFRTKLHGNKLPGGTSCKVSLKPGLKTLSGRVIATRGPAHSFQVDGPNLLSIYPGDTNGTSKGTVAEDQVFALGIDASVDAESMLRNAYFKVQGMASPVQIRILTEAEKQRLMKSQDFPDWEFRDGVQLVMIQPKSKFPANKDIAFVWGAGVRASESGITRKNDLVLPFASRPLLAATFSCTRENAKADCSPFSDMEVEFSADVPADQARKVYLVGEDGTIIHARVSPSEQKDNLLRKVTFPATVRERQRYKVVIPPGVHDDAGRPLSNEASFPLAVRTAEFPPLAKFAAEFGLLEATNPVLPATLRNLESAPAGANSQQGDVRGRSLRVDPNDFAAVVQWMKVLDLKSNQSRSFSDRDVSVFAKNAAATTPFQIPVQKNGKAFEVVGIDLKTTGFHIVELQSRLLGRSLLGADKVMYVPTGALVTNMVVHSKWGRESSVFWVTALDTGRPVPGANVTVHDCKGTNVWSATTDESGLARFRGELKTKLNLEACTADSDRDVNSRYDSGFFVSARTADDFTFTHTGWQEGIETYRFGQILESSPQWTENSVLAHTVLDRTLVRAGDKVGMKHFLRKPTAAGFRALSANELPNQVRVTHSDTGTEMVLPLQLDASGVGVTELELPKEAKLGLYNIVLEKKNGDTAVVSYDTASFQVMEFKIPLMKGVIAFPADVERLVQPGNLDAQVSVTYQDGGPAVNQPVVFRYTVNKSYGVRFEDYPSMNFGRERLFAQNRRTSDGETTNERTSEVPLRLDANGARTATVPGLSGMESPRTVTAQLEFTDKNGETQNVTRTVTVLPAARLVAVDVENNYGSNRRIQFKAAVVDAKGRPQVGALPAFELFENITYTHKTRMVGGYYSAESFLETKAVPARFECAGRTDVRGQVSCSVEAPTSGEFAIQAVVADEAGRKSYGSEDIYVRGERRAWFPPENNDRMDLIAEKKEVQAGEEAVFQVRMPFAEATVLVTVEREGVIDSFVRTLKTSDPRLRIPVKASYAPNVYVSALAVRGRVAGTEPTAVVDLGKPSYKLGLAPLNVNWKQNTLKVAVKPAKTTYRPREEARVDVTVTGADGKIAPSTEFAIAVIDEGLLELAKNRTWDLLHAMMNRRSLHVETATAQMQVVGKRHFGLKAKPVGGDGGTAPTRELFDTRIYWQARVKTDAAGKATVVFPMNDSLSKFRIVAVAHSGLSQFGKGEASIVSQQDVMVIPSLGSVAREGDVAATEFTVRNSTKAAKKVTMKGHVVYTMKDGSKKTVELTARDVELAPLASSSQNLGDVTVPEGAVSAEFLIDVTGADGERVDSLRITQRVKPAILPRVWMAQLGQVGDKGLEVPLRIPAGARANESAVSVQLMPTLASSLDTVTSALETSTFTSLESLVSRAAGTGSAKIWAEAMRKLPSHLDAQGLVQFYPGTTDAHGSESLTAYILTMAHGAGFDVPAESADKMIRGLINFVEGRSRDSRGREAMTPAETYIRRVNVIAALARLGKAQEAWLKALPTVTPEQVPTTTLVDLLSLHADLASANRDQEIADVQTSLKARLTRTGTGMRFVEGQNHPWYVFSSEDSDQLKLLWTLSAHADLAQAWRDEAPLLVRGSLRMMEHGCWDLSVANAVGVLALKSYAKRFEQGAVTGETLAALASAQQSFDWSAAGHEKGGTLNFAVPPAGDTKVTVSHRGTGAPWSIVSLKAAVVLKQKVERHIEVERTVSPAKDRYKKGDVLTVTLSVKPQADLPMVAVMDPIPAGAKILGSGLDNDASAGPETRGWAWPTYQELTYDAYRAHFDSAPVSGLKVIYRVQLNNAGTFQLPPTRVEALYLPENFAEVPNAPVVVEP